LYQKTLKLALQFPSAFSLLKAIGTLNQLLVCIVS